MKVIGRAKVNPKNLKENLYQWIVWAQSKSAGPNGRNPFLRSMKTLQFRTAGLPN